MIIVFTLWSNWKLKNWEGESREWTKVLNPILMALSSYFLAIEVVLIGSHTMGYLKSPWSYVKVIPMCLILYNTI